MANNPKITANSIEEFEKLEGQWKDLPDYTKETVAEIKYTWTTFFTHMIRQQFRSETIIPIKCMPSSIRIKNTYIIILDHNSYEHYYHFDCGSIPENLKIEIK